MEKDFSEEFYMSDKRTQTQDDLDYSVQMEAYFQKSLGSYTDKLRIFPKFVSRQSLSWFLAKSEIFKRIVNVHGYIVECGVYLGGGLMTWAQLSAIYEPLNHMRRIVGFDTFTGFVKISEKDKGDKSMEFAKEGGLAVDAKGDIEEALCLYDLNRPIGQIPKCELVVGDATKTMPEYLEKNGHLVVSLLYLDFDLYEPTKIALETFLPRMPKGAVIAFDELNQAQWPGETLATLEAVGIRNLRIERFPFVPQISFAVLD